LTINRRSSALPQLNERLSKKEDLIEIISKLILEVEKRERERAGPLLHREGDERGHGRTGQFGEDSDQQHPRTRKESWTFD
jgi:hypothetical protein